MVKYFSTKVLKGKKVIKGVIASTMKNSESWLHRQGKKMKMPYSIREISKVTAHRKALKFAKIKGSRFTSTPKFQGLYILKKR